MGSRDRRLATQSSDTAEINAAQRAAEAMLPPARRIFDDRFARHFVRRAVYRPFATSPLAARVGLGMLDRAMPGLHAIILMRARYAADALEQATAAHVDQLVLLGAGYDSSALHHDGARPLTVYEVDAPTTQAAKRERLAAAGLEPRSPTVYVPCDFLVDSPADRLAESGHDASVPSLVVWLGVSYYLSSEAFDAALADVARFAPPRSRLVLDYMDPEVVDGTTPHRGARRLARSVRRRGEPYLLGLTTDDAERRVRRTGFEPYDQVRMPELAARYGGVWCSTDDYFGIVAAERR